MTMKLGAHPFTVRQLQYAVAVAQARSFSRAAELCFVSQPALSAQVAELEDVLGVRLFERGRGGVLLTAPGEVLIERARRVLWEVEGLLGAAEGLGDPLQGTLRLGVIPTIAPYLLPTLDPSLRAAFKKIELIWREDKTENLVGALGKGELDAAVVALEARLGDVDHAMIGIDPFVLAVPKAHRLGRSRRPVASEELADEHVLLLDDGHCFRDQALEWCGAAGTRELGFRATSVPTLCQMVAGGAGITLLPKLAVPVEGPHSSLVIRNFKKPAPQRTIVLIWRRGSALTSALRDVAETARRAFPKMR